MFIRVILFEKLKKIEMTFSNYVSMFLFVFRQVIFCKLVFTLPMTAIHTSKNHFLTKLINENFFTKFFIQLITFFFHFRDVHQTQFCLNLFSVIIYN